LKHLLYLPILYISLVFSQVDIDTLWTFTNCSQTGRFGPTLDQCEAEYPGTTLEGQITMDGFQGYQEWTVTFSGLYSIEVRGAQGGNSGGYFGGSGARMKGNFVLQGGDILNILVGQTGENLGSCNTGAGGGSFVWDNMESPIIISGGGGGAGNGYNGYFGVSTVNGTYAYPSGGFPGTNGYGANPGGAGWYSNGSTGANGGGGGISPLNGGTGGLAGSGSTGDGGFGGGSGGTGGGLLFVRCRWW
jgi:hypothetical protein